MLTQASDYLYYTPIAAGVHGQPMPVRTGAAKSVVKYEDIVYLAEMVAERQRWNFENPSAVDSNLINASSVVLSAADFSLLQTAAEDLGRDEGFKNLFAALPAEWADTTSTNTPLVGDAVVAAWRASAAFPTYSRSPVSCVDSTAPYSALFSYLDSFRRYMLHNLEGPVLDSAAAGVSSSDCSLLFGQTGDALLSETDNGTTTTQTIPSAISPWYMTQRYKASGIWHDYSQSASAPGGNSLYVHRDLAVNRLTGQPFFSAPTLYLHASGRVVFDGSATDYMPIIVKLGTLAAPSASGLALWPLRFALGSVVPDALGLVAHPALKAWAEENIPGFTTTGEKPFTLTVQFTGVFLDTGVIAHCSNLQA